MAISHSILLVDDDHSVRRIFERALRRAGYEVVGVDNAADALKLASQREFAVVAADYAMPNIDGIELIVRLRKMQPDASYVLVSGYGPECFSPDVTDGDGADFMLGKPCSVHDLAGTVAQAVAQFETRVGTNGH